MLKRRRFKQSTTLEERLTTEAARLRGLADDALDATERDELLRRAEQYDSAEYMNGFLRSHDLKPPT